MSPIEDNASSVSLPSGSDSEKASFLPQELIRTKRDGGTLSAEDIIRFVQGIITPADSHGHVSREQIAAMAMAVFLRGMEKDETTALTRAMRDSGDVMDWQSLGFDADAPIVDKHSTGGVGDKVSLMLAPIVAAAGGLVPMISGRGLGHTGGTLDKLEAIPGYDPYPDNQKFAKIVADIGCSIIGQTGNLAPADKIFYSVRDVTATVEAIPLITASILSKKLAAGLKGLVMDVKFGTGAFMQNYEDARALAQSIVRVAGAAGTPTTALLTDMNEVLGRSAGNSIEMLETIEFLENPELADPRLLDVTLALAAEMLVIVGVQRDVEAARLEATKVLSTGQALDVFARMVAAQGGPINLIEKAGKHLPLASTILEVKAPSSGIIASVDTRQIGLSVVAMGGGRTAPDQKIDHGVGVDHILGIGSSVAAGERLASIYARDDRAAEAAAARIRAAYVIGDQPASPRPVVAEIMRADG